MAMAHLWKILNNGDCDSSYMAEVLVLSIANIIELLACYVEIELTGF